MEKSADRMGMGVNFKQSKTITVNPKLRLAMLQMMAAAMEFEHPSNRDSFKHPNDNSTKPTMPTFEVNGMFIQAVNEQAAKDKYDKIISKRNRKQKQ